MFKFVIPTIVMVLIIKCGSITDSEIENNSNAIYKGAGQESFIFISFKEAVATSSLIVEAVVKDINFYSEFNEYIGYAIVTLSVQDIIKGECSEEILLSRWDVNKNLEFRKTEYMPVYFKDKKYILCLIKNLSKPEENYSVIGSYNGAFEIKDGKVAGSYIAGEYFDQRIKNGMPIEDFKREIIRFMNSVKIIEFDIPEDSYVKIIIYNIYGQEIEILRDNFHISQGKRRFIWDGTPYGSGLYICRLKAKDFVKTKKIILLK